MCDGGNERPEFRLLDCASARETVRLGVGTGDHIEAAMSRLMAETWDVVLWGSTDLLMTVGWRGCVALSALPVATLLGRRAARSLAGVLVPLDTYLDDEQQISMLPPSSNYHTSMGSPSLALQRPSSAAFAWQSNESWERVKSD